MDKLVRRRHAVPNALLPTITLVFLNIGFVVSGAITVETVFSWPGLGLLSYEAIRGPDVPLLQAIFLLFSIARHRREPRRRPASYAAARPAGAHMTRRPQRRASSRAPARARWRAARRRGRAPAVLAAQFRRQRAGHGRPRRPGRCSCCSRCSRPVLFSSRRARRDQGDRASALAAAVAGVSRSAPTSRPLGARAGGLGRADLAARRLLRHGASRWSSAPWSASRPGHYRGCSAAVARRGSPTGSWSSRSCRWRSCSRPCSAAVAAQHHHRHRRHLLARHRPAGPRPDPVGRGAALPRAGPGARRRPLAPDDPARAAQRDAAGARQHHADRRRSRSCPRPRCRSSASATRPRLLGPMLDDALRSRRDLAGAWWYLAAAGHLRRPRRAGVHPVGRALETILDPRLRER